jgi:hypothetical protein
MRLEYKKCQITYGVVRSDGMHVARAEVTRWPSPSVPAEQHHDLGVIGVYRSEVEALANARHRAIKWVDEH